MANDQTAGNGNAAAKPAAAQASPPAVASEVANLPAELTTNMPIAMALWFDERLFQKAKMIATYLSRAEGFVPPHLLNKQEACFAIVERALVWKLSPYAVAQATYQTPGGKVGYEGKLCQAILENSSKLKGGVKFEHFGTVTVKMREGNTRNFRTYDPALDAALEAGAVEVSRRDWSNVEGKFEIRRSEKGKDFAVPTWTAKDAEGLGVMVRGQVIGEAEMREWPLLLIQCFPRNSTLWATDPRSQICYTAVRRFASLAAPGLFMGVPFDREEEGGIPLVMEPDGTYVPADPPTRRPTRGDFQPARTVTDVNGNGNASTETPSATDAKGDEGAAASDASQGSGSAAPASEDGHESGIDEEAHTFELYDEHGELVKATADGVAWAQELSNRLRDAAERGDGKALDTLFTNNSPQISKLPKEIAEGVRSDNEEALKLVDLKQRNTRAAHPPKNQGRTLV